MAYYMLQLAYTPDAWTTFLRHPQDRTDVWREHLDALGCRLVCLYYAFGEYDLVTIFEAPDEPTALAAIISTFPAGHLKATKTTVLVSTAEAVDAMRKGATVRFHGPMSPG
jgi:uncharacterized protein with GYD domain